MPAVSPGYAPKYCKVRLMAGGLLVEYMWMEAAGRDSANFREYP
jgi:hypothetical protein